MPETLKNINEDIALDFLNNSLMLRFDICVCPQCKNDMHALILSNIPAKYITTEKGRMASVIEQTKIEHQAMIAKAALMAIDKVSKNPRHKVKEDKEQVFQMLLNKIYEDRGIDFRQYHQGVIKRKIAVRIRSNKLESYADYFRYLVKNPNEYDKMLEELCINVTEFFRDPRVWAALNGIFEKAVRHKKSRNENKLRIWSAGCSSGEEPYSIAIAFNEFIKDKGLSDISADIFATDIDQKCLNMAKDALYSRGSLKNVNERLLKDYFIPLENGEYRLKDEIKSMVKIQYLNLISAEPIINTDIVFCRNVFIYFNRDLQEQLLMKFYKSLRQEGYLVKGQAETIFSEAGAIFKDVDIENRIYQKKEA